MRVKHKLLPNLRVELETCDSKVNKSLLHILDKSGRTLENCHFTNVVLPFQQSVTE